MPLHDLLEVLVRNKRRCRVMTGAFVGAVAMCFTSVALAAAPTSGLVGYWGFDETSGNIAVDGSGNSNTGTLSGSGATRTAGRVGTGALSFNGASAGRVTIPHSATLNLSSFTLTAWLRPTALSGYQTAVHKGTSAACSYWLQTKGANPTSGFGTASSCTGYAEHVVTNTTLQLNVWYHVAASFDNAANTLTYYVNANPVYSVADTRAPANSQESLIFGESSYSGGGFERWRGQLDEVRIYNRALNAAEIANVFNDTGSGSADTQAPTIPSDVTATPVSSTRIDVAWTASGDNVGVAGYRIYRGGALIASTAATTVSDIGLQPSTSYSYTVAAYDAAQNASAQSTAAPATTQGAPPTGDTTPPSVSMTAPAANAIVRGSTVAITASASDNIGVSGVQFLLDGVAIGAEDTGSPYSLTWNTTNATDGPHQLTARARDAAGNTTTSQAVGIRVDNLPPTGTITINGGADATSSRNVTLTLSATDVGSSVTHMRFANGSSFSTPETFAATRNWTLSSGSGLKTVRVQYRDESGTWSPAFTDTIVRDAAAPTISAVTASGIGPSSATISWTTNENATSRVEFGPTPSYGQSTQQGQLVTSHSVVLANLAETTLYYYRVRSSDAAGNERIGSGSSFKTSGTDRQPPSTPTNVTATPAAYSSAIDVAWTASTDNAGPVTYEVLRNGAVVASAVAAPTYRDSGLTPATTYAYTVRAADAQGNLSPVSDPPAEATTPPPQSSGQYVYPLRLSEDRRYLIDQNSRPFFMNGDTAWSLFAQISREDAEVYLADRQQKGYNVVLASLIERRFASNAPNNVYGAAPFAVGGTFTSPNEAYFAHADAVINSAADKGIVVLVSPLYLGYACGGEGWCPEVQEASSSALREWGRYVGNRYKNFPNIVWMIGGDTDPNDTAGVADKVREFVLGLREHDTVNLITAHNKRGQSAMDAWLNEAWLDVNNIYTDSTTHLLALSEYNRGADKPLFFVEGLYENEHGMTPTDLRKQAYNAVLSGATAGHLFGNCPIWNFGFTVGFCTPTNWQQQLGSTGSQTLAYVGRLFLSRSFHPLVPDQANTVLTAGYQSGSSYAAAARTASGDSVIVYMPSRRAVTIDMTKLSGTMARAWWFDPSTGQATVIGDFTTIGSRQFTPPTSSDWVLVLDDLSLGLPAPGTLP